MVPREKNNARRNLAPPRFRGRDHSSPSRPGTFSNTIGVRANRKVYHRANLIVDHPGIGFRGSSV